MAIQPSNAHLLGRDSQTFISNIDSVTWTISPQIGELTPAADSCIYTAPPKHRVWFSRQIVLSAIDANRQSAASAVITLDSGPSWIAVLTLFYAILFLGLVISIVAIWPLAPVSPSVEVTPPTVTVAPGLTQQFEASVWHERDQNVTWSATSGLITPTGLFTAPATSPADGGRVIITATSNADKSLTRSALVLIHSPGLAVQPASVILGPSEPKSLHVLQVTNGAGGEATQGGASSSSLDWLVSERSVTITPSADRMTANIQAPAKLGDRTRVVVTVRDTTPNVVRQASAIVFLSHDQAPLALDLSQEERQRDKGLLKLVMLMGALGALLGASRSLGNFVGNRAFVPAWTLFYIFRPTFGAGLALLVFFGYRIGAISAVKGSTPADPFAAAFVTGLVGLFADTVLQKLKDVITALLPSQDERRDKVNTPIFTVPVIDAIDSSSALKKMTIKGKNFAAGASVSINGKEKMATLVSSSELTAVLDATDMGDVKVVVTNPDKHATPEFFTRIG